MAVGSLSFAIPTFAAAVGAYFLSNRQYMTKHVENPSQTSTERSTVVSKEEQKKEKKKGDLTRFAVELDGLNCFETLVAH